MRILKWRPGFKYEEDPPIVPIWVSLFGLPIEILNLEVIFSMATAIRKPLKVDAPMVNMMKPSVACFCVEVDITKDFPKSVKVGKKGKKHDQIFTDEHIPDYCSKCCKIGHKKEDCRIGKPNPLVKKGQDHDGVDVSKKKGGAKSVHVKATNPRSQGDVTKQSSKGSPKLLQGGTPANPNLSQEGATTSLLLPKSQGAAIKISEASSLGLTAVEKESIPMDIPSTENMEKGAAQAELKEPDVAPAPKPADLNCFSILASITELDG
ncbi:OLC1v1016174C1 [Oldenlandia corymbosa var. corymbosa]|uniref:OLC1v1016174C1 n=1 Tax=Oldenlandia corymbosa var. corymbosa TaxID=529605 RepID=A0AAV1E7A5_OLDCO|nr:OLC1v1016174C1 [Oldenlandia corymbosa var. corymbosa]